MKRFRHFVVLLFALALVAAACGDDTSSTTTTAAATTAAPATTAATTTTEAPPAERTLIIGTTDAIASLDGADAYAVHDWELLKNIGEGLLKWEPGSGDNLIPGVATDFGEFSADGLSYTITLRDDVFFGDGTQLDAHMYADQINDRLLVLEGPNGVGPALGQPYVASAEALDDYTVRFNLTDTWAFFPQLLAGAPYIPTHPEQFGAELNLFPDAPVYGVGPWFIESYSVDEQAVLKPNPFYYGDAPALDSVIIRYFGDPQTMALAVETGEIDVAWRILGPELIEQLEATDGMNVFTIPAGPIRYFIINHTLAPTDDANVRAAIAYLIDRDEISDRVFGGAVDPLYSPVPPGFLGAFDVYDDVYGSPDVDAAVAALAASGYTADNPLELTVAYPPEHYGGTVADTMQVIKENLEASGAINVNLVAQEWSTYVGAVIGGEDYPVSFLGWFYDYPDPDNYLSPFILNGGLGTNVSDSNEAGDQIATLPEWQPLVDKLLEAAANPDPAEREALYREIQQLHAEIVVTLPLWLESEHIVYRDGVFGSDDFPTPETLNIGPTIEFNYTTLDFG